MRLETCSLGDVSLGYLDWGPRDAARTVVCVHGLTRNARDFDELAEELAARGARVLAVDVAGRGRSSWLQDPSDYAVPVYAGHLSALLQGLGLHRVDWVGTSMGGLIGMALAAAEETPIGRLVLNDVGPLIPEAALRQIGRYLGLDPAFASLEDLERHLREIHAPFGALTDAQWRHLATHSARRSGAAWRLHYDPRIRVPFEAQLDGDVDLWSLWDRIAVPTFVLRGADSTLLRPETAAAMRGRGPKAEVATVPHVGHAPALMDDGQIATVAGWLGL